MIEVEIKAAVGDIGPIRSKLKELECIYQGHLDQADTYYNARDRDFAVTDEAIRIRIENERTLITYKGPKLGGISKSRREIELEVSEAATAEEMLIALGFTRVMTVTKTRENYVLDMYTISLDTVTGLGDFIEIETSAQNEVEVPAKVEDIVKLLEKLGISQDAAITSSYLELLNEKKTVK